MSQGKEYCRRNLLQDYDCRSSSAKKITILRMTPDLPISGNHLPVFQVLQLYI